MSVAEKDLHRAASRLVEALVSKGAFELAGQASGAEEKVFEALRENFREEARIDREAERMLGELGRQSAGMDQRTLLRKIREKIAKERGFVL